MLKLKATLEIERIHPDGQRRVRKLPVNSWLWNYAKYCHGNWAHLTGALGVQPQATSGAWFSWDPAYANADEFRADAAATSDTYGIWVGTGTTPVDRNDYTLAVKIAHGNGAGQLYYQACVVTSMAGISGGYEVVISRQFDNNSGGNITVNEVSLVVKMIDWVGGTRYVQMLRDLIAGGEVVANGGSVVFRYKLQWTA